MILKPLAILMLYLLLAPGFNVQASEQRQSLASIALQAEAFISDYPYASPYPVSFKLARLDPRLKLKPCQQPLEINFSQAGRATGNTALTIQCHTPVNWKLHLPVRVDLYDDVALNQSPLIRGQSIDSTRIIYRKKKISNLQRGYFTRKDPLNRLQARRNLPAGTILSPANVAEKMLVKSGQIVNIILNIRGLRIKSSGKALQSAALDKVIRVKNTQSNKIIEATVSGDGEVQVHY